MSEEQADTMISLLEDIRSQLIKMQDGYNLYDIKSAVDSVATEVQNLSQNM